MDAVTNILLLGSKITANGDCSHEIKRHLPLGRKATSNLDSDITATVVIKKQRHHLPTKIHIVKALVFPVIMYRFDS